MWQEENINKYNKEKTVLIDSKNVSIENILEKKCWIFCDFMPLYLKKINFMKLSESSMPKVLAAWEQFAPMNLWQGEQPDKAIIAS